MFMHLEAGPSVGVQVEDTEALGYLVVVFTRGPSVDKVVGAAVVGDDQEGGVGFLAIHLMDDGRPQWLGAVRASGTLPASRAEPVGLSQDHGIDSITKGHPGKFADTSAPM
ncbi:hypothetical protein ACQPZF_35805 [Actinosynnema sp. CS-041913]|uniref:hypothetical protein n=1 Tax=Actinosynnema sp. CS-041913 TaxID=3239917 RepID=UPI003D92984B